MTKANSAKLSGRGYWRSLEELAQTDEFAELVEDMVRFDLAAHGLSL